MLYIYYTAEVFNEIAYALYEALTQLQIRCHVIQYISQDLLAKGQNNLYIIIGLNNKIAQLPPRYIAYQFEQTGNANSWFNEDYLTKLRGALEIWDYSIKNIQNCKQYPNLPPTRYVPLGYTQNLTRIRQKQATKRYDILFYGSANPRRDELMERLRQRGFSVYYSTYQCWGTERDEKIAQSRIVLNIHYYTRPILETTRLTYLISNGAFVITEPSLDPILDKAYQSLVKFADYDDIVEQCQYYLAHSDERQQFARQAFESFRQNNPYKSQIPIVDLQAHINPPATPTVITPPPGLESIIPTPTKQITPSTLSPIEMSRNRFQKAEVEITSMGSILKLSDFQIPDEELPKVTLITPTARRSWVLGLPTRNFYQFDYPRDKIEWIILDSEPSDPVYMPPDPRIKYEVVDHNIPLWEKRNLAVQKATGEIIVHLDDDDYYFPDSLKAKVRLLKKYKAGCVGCLDIGVYHLMDNYSYMAETRFICEASMAYTREFWEQQPFQNTNLQYGEGYGFLLNRESQVRTFPYYFNLIAITHFQNCTGALRSLQNNTPSRQNHDNYFNLWDADTRLFILELQAKAKKAQIRLQNQQSSSQQITNPFE